MEQFWQYLVITDLKATERSKNTHSSQNMSDLGKCRVDAPRDIHACEISRSTFRETNDDKDLCMYVM